ncbi:MAG: hypothetical protein ABTQ25_12555 [Nitrosomonas ureae]
MEDGLRRFILLVCAALVVFFGDFADERGVFFLPFAEDADFTPGFFNLLSDKFPAGP